MASFTGLMAGYKGCDRSTGGATVTAPVGMKIAAIGIHATANITNYKYTPPTTVGAAKNQKTVTTKGWMGVAEDPSAVTAFIPLDFPADSVTYASGTIYVYYI